MAALNANGISNPGQKLSTGDRLAQFLTVFSGEVLTAFTRTSVMNGRHMMRTITNGKASSFPIMGRTSARYLTPGNSLDDQRKKMEHNERVINIDGLLTADCLITDIDDAMNHYDVRMEYSRQLGEALALGMDKNIINELANLAVKGSTDFDENIPDNTTLGNLGTGKSFEFVTGLDDKTASIDLGKKLLEGLVDARAKFSRSYVPMQDRYFLCSPEAYSSIINALLPTSANFAAVLNPETGKLTNVCGFEIIETPHFINEGTDGKHTLNAKIQTAAMQGLAFHRSAVGTVKLKDLAMERARRAEYQADQIIAKYAMGHAGLRPEAVGIFTKTAQE